MNDLIRQSSEGQNIPEPAGDEDEIPQGASRENLPVLSGEEGMRLDLFLSGRLGITRSFARKLVEEGNVVILPERRTRPGLKLSAGATVTAMIPPAERLELEPEEVPFDVVYEDEEIVVVNKPSGIVVHPAPGNWHGTLVHGLLHRFRDFGAFNNILRPGIVHRLDASTSGLLVIARTQSSLESLQEQFRNRTVEKKYLALAEGRMKTRRGIFESPVGRSGTNRLRMAAVPWGKPASTEFLVLWTRGGFSFMQCLLHTGRTHQIRVHLSSAGHPLVGDILYGAKSRQSEGLGRVFLHSWKLAFRHPATGRRVPFTSCLPEPLTGLLREILSTAGD